MHGGQGELNGLLLVLAIAFFIPIFLHRSRMNAIPVVVAEIIAGMVIGKSGFNIIQEGMWLTVLSTLGFLFLMFLSGLEIDFSAFKQKTTVKKGGEPNAFKVASIIFAGIFILSYIFSLLFVQFGLVDSAFFMTLVISTISLGVVVPTLKENNLMKKTFGQILLLIAVIADLATMILLAVFVSVNSPDGAETWLLLLLFFAGVVFYLLAKKFVRSDLIDALSTGSVQIQTRAIFFLIMVLVVLSENVGAESILGAFLAGALVSLLSPNHEVVSKLDAIGYGFFIPVFFVMVGVDLDVQAIFQEPSALIFIPVLLVCFFLSKFIPLFLLKKWYGMKKVISSSLLLTTTLSLVIAAASIGEGIGVISSTVASSLILGAIITCLIGPILYKKMEPPEEEETKSVAIIGANRMTLPLSLYLKTEGYEVALYTEAKDNVGELDHEFPLVVLDDLSKEMLHRHGIFNQNITVFATSDDEQNIAFAKYAEEESVENVIVRVEDPVVYERVAKEGLNVFSTLHSSRILLKALIHNPSLVKLITQADNALEEVMMRNGSYDGTKLRHLPLLGDILVIQIYRGKQAIVPHGDTELRVGDRLLVSGSKEYINAVKKTL
ncbi:monovalent cation:proton antiporter family protein [Priestia taiwanensis]|uniref:Sodium:proton antiporter n=1 Tax=Priestia taiwanensis TaxID=1347902 RepID=A0A917AKR2_9BACI|nr:monovalent cation:proton antiporter family protein [Priestia taiwanensis]MBM7362010.1 Kef-type K+ transport system membrane component KefB/Trk K+ transport system NAD-binding subunit [Priestia taiwanensis]GGE58716.1 sodium:proton antiporter [Priestia taiwanensis]